MSPASVFQEESMSHEVHRLASFETRPRGFLTSASKLANTGFYYIGPGYTTACYKCKVVVDDWDSLGVTVDPMVVHDERSPECEFINNKAKDDVPYTSSHKLEELPIKISPRLKSTPLECVKTEMQNGDIETDSASEGLTTTTFARNEAVSAVPNTGNSTTTGSSLMSSRVFSNSLGDLFGEASNQATYLASNGTGFGNPPITRPSFSFSDLHNGSRGAPFQLPEASPTPRDPEPARYPEPPAPKDYKKEVERRESYRYWTHAHTLSPAEMAKAGFYFIGTEDRVQCAFCKGILRNWEPSDNAMEEHKKHFPSCPFLKDPKSSGNVPSAPEVSGVNFRKGMNSDTSPEDFQLGIMSQSAYRTDLAGKVERMDTFVNFNSESVRKPEEFAEAGFYLTGSNFPNLESVVDMIGMQDSMQDVDNIDWMDEEIEEQRELSREIMPLPALGFTPKCKAGQTKGNNNHRNRADKTKNKKPGEVAETESEAIDFMTEETGKELAKTVQKMKDNRLCKVCLDADANIVFLKCGHLVCCLDCAPAQRTCPICGEVIRGTILVNNE